MSEEQDLQEFAASIVDEVRDRAEGETSSSPYSEEAFMGWVSEGLSDLGLVENPVACYHQGRWGKESFRLHGYAVSDDEEPVDRLDIFIALYSGVEKPASVPGQEITRAAGWASRAVEAALHKIHEKMESANDRYSMMRRLSEVLLGGAQEVRIWVVTNGLSSVKRIKSTSIGGVKATFEVYDLKRLMRLMASGGGRGTIDIDLAEMGLDPIPCVAMPSADEGYEAYLAIFPGEALYGFYEKFGPRLLEYNVRAFLQATGRVNRGIRDTLHKEPQRFMAYNNGISVTVDELATESSNGGLVITRLKGLQVVNGGQTTASIHRARKREGVDLSRVHVAAKITRLPSDQVEVMVANISRYANTQNVIQEADFSSNEPFHIVLERLSNSIWCPDGQTRWFYERARGQYRTAMHIEGSTPARLRAFKERTPAQQRFSKTDLAKILNSWNRLPHIVGGGAQKNFVAFMRDLRGRLGSSWEPDDVFYKELIAKAILFKEVSSIVRQEGFPAYRANIASYLVSYLSHRTAGYCDFDAIWRQQSLSADLGHLLRAWSHSVAQRIQESSGGRNVTEWCKKEGCWSAVKALALSFPDNLPPELQRSTAIKDNEGALLSAEDQASASECMRISAEQWFDLHKWGLQTGFLKKWQSGIAHTLSGYAADGWQRVPSPKQARQAMAILETARKNGFWPLHGSKIEGV